MSIEPTDPPVLHLFERIMHSRGTFYTLTIYEIIWNIAVTIWTYLMLTGYHPTHFYVAIWIVGQAMVLYGFGFAVLAVVIAVQALSRQYHIAILERVKRIERRLSDSARGVDGG